MVTTDSTVGAELRAAVLLDQARAATGLVDVGEPELPERLEAYLGAVRREAHLSEEGALRLRGLVVMLLMNRLLTQEDLRTHPEILAEPVTAPLIVTGMFRTGTTKMQRLMCADPGVQALPLWRVLNVARQPGSDPAAPDQRIAVAEMFVSMLDQESPDFRSAHAWGARDPEEDSILLWLTFDHLAGAVSAAIPSFVDRVTSRPQESSYQYLRSLLQYLQWQDGGARGRPWVLKSPTHIGNLIAIASTFPDATVIHCHRDPVAVVGSSCRLFEHLWNLWGEDIDRRAIGAEVLRVWSFETQRNQQQREQLAGALQIVDVQYDDICRDAVGVVRDVLAVRGETLATEAEGAMRAWEAANPQHRNGIHTYSLGDYGLTAEQVRARFAPYTATFLSA